MNVTALREQFPFFSQHPDIIYLDNAATTQKPQSVINTINQFYTTENANASRGAYPLSSVLTERIKTARQRVADFIGCNTDEVFFTSGATSSYDILARLLEHLYQDGDSIVCSRYDHQSFAQPLERTQQRLARNGKQINLRKCNVTHKGDVSKTELASQIDSSTKLIAVSHIHNIFGADTEPADIPKPKDAVLVMDMAQSVSCGLVNMNTMPHVDAIAFSGHKMFAAQGVGVLMLKKSLQQRLLGSPEILQGETLRTTIESGTGHWAGIVSLVPAIEFIESAVPQLIHEHQALCTQRLIAGLRTVPGITFTPGPANWTCLDGYGIVSFNIDGLLPANIGFALAEQGICVRAGTHCSATADVTTSSVRISTHIYTTCHEIDQVVSAIRVLAAYQ